MRATILWLAFLLPTMAVANPPNSVPYECQMGSWAYDYQTGQPAYPNAGKIPVTSGDGFNQPRQFAGYIGKTQVIGYAVSSDDVQPGGGSPDPWYVDAGPWRIDAAYIKMSPPTASQASATIADNFWIQAEADNCLALLIGVGKL